MGQGGGRGRGGGGPIPWWSQKVKSVVQGLAGRAALALGQDQSFSYGSVLCVTREPASLKLVH